MRRRFVIAGLIGLLAAAPAWPCSIAVESHVLDDGERGIDKTAPSAPVVEVAELKRGRAPRQAGHGSFAVSSCDDIGMVTLHVTRSSDDRTPAPKLGYRAVWVSGDLPEDMDLSQTVRIGGDALTLAWIDEARDDQEPIDFVLAVVAVDLAGNESTPSASVRIQHDGVASPAKSAAAEAGAVPGRRADTRARFSKD